MRSFILLVILTLVIPNYSQAFFIRDKELAEVLARMNRNEEEKALNSYLETTKSRERVTVKVTYTGPLDSVTSVAEYKNNLNGFVEGNDPRIVRDLGDRALKHYNLKFSKYFTLNIDRGESSSKVFTSSGCFALWIPEDYNQYWVELQYLKNGKEISSAGVIAEQRTFFRGPEAGITLVVRVTRVQKIDK